MNSKSLGILVVLGLLLLAAAMLATRESSEEDTAGGLLVPELKSRLNEVSGISIIAAGDVQVATLEKGATGWQVLEK